MNIYKIEWVQGGSFGLSAVVISNTEEEALKELHLDSDDREIEISLIGICTDGTTESLVVCHESL